MLLFHWKLETYLLEIKRYIRYIITTLHKDIWYCNIQEVYLHFRLLRKEGSLMCSYDTELRILRSQPSDNHKFFFAYYDKQRILRTFYNPNTQPDTQGPNYCRVSLLFHGSQSMCVVNITTQKWSFFIHPSFWNITTIFYACFTYNDNNECTYLIKQTNSNLK